MTTFYKFPDEKTFAALETEVPVDVIGLIQDGVDEAGEPIYIDGWHVNTLQPVEGWEDYEVAVNSPVRIYG